MEWQKMSMATTSANSTLQCQPVFDLIEKKIEQEGESLVKKVKGSYLFKIKASDGKVHEWLVDLSSGSGSVKTGSGLKGQCVLSVPEQVFMDMVTGKTNAQKAFFSGKLKISGNTALALRLQNVMPQGDKSKL